MSRDEQPLAKRTKTSVPQNYRLRPVRPHLTPAYLCRTCPQLQLVPPSAPEQPSSPQTWTESGIFTWDPPTRAIATDSFRFMPPESVLACAFCLCCSPNDAVILSTSALIPLPRQPFSCRGTKTTQEELARTQQENKDQ